MTTKKCIYTGRNLRTFLHQNGLSYKDVAAKLGIDKNTVGKAVRGGNMNVNILLLFCNEYGLDITDFFTTSECGDMDYLNSLPKENPMLEEECEKYKKCEISHAELLDIKEGLDRNATLLQEVSEECRRYCDLLHNKISQQ